MILGSSHAVRLDQQWQQYCTEHPQHDPALVKVKIIGIGGTTAKDQLQHSSLFAMAKAYRPAVVYILLGGNDLDSNTSAEETRELLMSFCKKLEELPSTKHCLICTPLTRYSTRHIPIQEFQQKLNSLVEMLETHYPSNYFPLTYKQKFKTYIPSTKFQPDQVHLLDTMGRILERCLSPI